MSNPPISGLDELTPLFACGAIYFVILVVLRLFLIPQIAAIRKRSKLPQMLNRGLLRLQQLLFYGLLVLAGLFGLGYFLGDNIEIDLSETEVWMVLGGAAILFLLYVIVGRRRRPRRR